MNTNVSSSTTNQWLHKATKQLEAAGIGTARLDCLVLLEDILQKDRSWVLAHPESRLSIDQLKTLEKQLKRRENHEPLAYVRGKTEFYGREFSVNAHTLEPRPETEDMIDLIKELRECGHLADIGTGSGAIGITVALEMPDTEVILTDIDPLCIEIAKQNADIHKVNVTFAQGDLLQPIAHFSPVVFACNLPYVPDSHTINQAAMQEPNHAIFGGTDGLDIYRKFFAQVQAAPQKPEHILTESLPFQHDDLNIVAQESRYQLKETRGFIQLFAYQELS